MHSQLVHEPAPCSAPSSILGISLMPSTQSGEPQTPRPRPAPRPFQSRLRCQRPLVEPRRVRRGLPVEATIRQRKVSSLKRIAEGAPQARKHREGLRERTSTALLKQGTQESNVQASTALIVRRLLGWTLANPPLTVKDEHAVSEQLSNTSSGPISPECPGVAPGAGTRRRQEPPAATGWR